MTHVYAAWIAVQSFMQKKQQKSLIAGPQLKKQSTSFDHSLFDLMEARMFVILECLQK